MGIKLLSISVAFMTFLIAGLYPARGASGLNSSGYTDTSAIVDTLDSASVKYSKAFRLSAYEDLRVLVKCDDSTSAGFASDSLNFAWGYQTGTLTYDSTFRSTYRDTAWDDLIYVDTIRTDSLGDVNTGKMYPDGSILRYWGGVDTLSVLGYAVQSRRLKPEWDEFIRFFAVSLGGIQKKGAPIELIFEPHRRVGVLTGGN